MCEYSNKLSLNNDLIVMSFSPFILMIKWNGQQKHGSKLTLRVYLIKPYPKANPIANDQFINL